MNTKIVKIAIFTKNSLPFSHNKIIEKYACYNLKLVHKLTLNTCKVYLACPCCVYLIISIWRFTQYEPSESLSTPWINTHA